MTEPKTVLGRVVPERELIFREDLLADPYVKQQYPDELLKILREIEIERCHAIALVENVVRVVKMTDAGKALRYAAGFVARMRP